MLAQAEAARSAKRRELAVGLFRCLLIRIRCLLMRRSTTSAREYERLREVTRLHNRTLADLASSSYSWQLFLAAISGSYFWQLFLAAFGDWHLMLVLISTFAKNAGGPAA